ncbi:MAG: hypothetical protein ACRCTX_14175 [Afipia sp.]
MEILENGVKDKNQGIGTQEARAQGLPERRERGNRMVPVTIPNGGKKLNKNNAPAGHFEGEA